MTQKTIYKRAKRKFSMAQIAKRIKKRFWKKDKKKITKIKIREVWKDIVDIEITRPLLNGEKVNIDGHLCLEVVAEKITDRPDLIKLMVEGKKKTPHGIKPFTDDINPLRRGLVYGIEMMDDRHKEKIYFDPHPNIKKKLNNELQNTFKPYRVK